ncbi:cytochrome P450 [Penicillium atrosanguineum]|uniref:Cytochrome P450 n=1 Tax=Penicillium atrosanguineum TaxID=1132637 RepID=A0A9W9U8U2_9EURO|nr:cytochrome P450 [Penicillium atrosanguineum]
MAFSQTLMSALYARQSSVSTLLLVNSLLVLFIYFISSRLNLFFKRRQFSSQNGCKPLLARYKDRFFGLSFIFENANAFKEKAYLNKFTSRYFSIGYTHEVVAMGGRGVFTIDPVNIKTMLSLKFKDYSLGNRPAIMGPLLGRGVFVTDGEEWAHSRALLRPSFNKSQVADLTIMESHLQVLLRLIPSSEDGAKHATTFDLQPSFFRFTMDSSTEFLFGTSTHTLTEGGDQIFSDAFVYALNDISLGLRLGPWEKFRRTDPKAVEAHRFCRQYIDKYVDQALEYRKAHQGDMAEKKDGKKRTFLQELATATDDKDKLRDELLSLLLAGRDTTASLISSLFFCLAKRPEIWSKLREEVATELNGQKPQYEQLRNLKYAKYCVNETLRLYPPVPNNAKMAIRDTVLPRGGGPDGDAPILIEKGNWIIYTVYAMHRRKDLFGEDADEFRPERWVKNEFTWQYLPFNGGPRVCLGQQYALTEALYVLVRFAQEFEEIESRDPRPWIEDLTLTVSGANGVKVMDVQYSVQSQTPKGSGYNHARRICVESSTETAKILHLYEAQYTFRRINVQAAAITGSAALMLIFATILNRHGSDHNETVGSLNVCFRAYEEFALW